MNFADDFKKNTDYKGSEKKKKKPFDASENGERVNINVHLKEEELDETISLTKKEICLSALSTLSSIYFVFRDVGEPIDFKLRDFIDETVSTVIQDLFMLDKFGGAEKVINAGGEECFRDLWEIFKETSRMETVNFATEDGDEDDEV